MTSENKRAVLYQRIFASGCFLIVILVLAAVICIGASLATFTFITSPPPTPSSSSTTTVAAGITGTWEGKGVEGGGYPYTYPYTDTLFLTQTGNSITGTSNTQRQTVTSSGTITGDISGNSVRLAVHDAACTRYYELTLSQDGQSLNGYYLGCGVINKQTIELAKR